MSTPDRRDVVRNRAAILAATVELLDEGEEPTAGSVAWRAGLARATIYRHYPTVGDLLAEAEAARAARSPGSGPEAAGDGSGIADLPGLLDRVAPPQLPEQIVAETQSRAQAREVAVYLVDIGGTLLRRIAGSRTFPPEIPVPLAVGPEIAPEGIEALHEAVADALPSATVAPMIVRDRATGVLAALDAQDGARLQAIARHAGVALATSEPFTDVIASARRARPTTAAAETQQMLLAPRVARLPGLRFAGNVLPAYENGGNWFDHAENGDGAWIAAVDTLGAGARAAATGAVALGALRAARTAGANPRDALVAMDDAIGQIGGDGVECSAFVARWHPLTSTLFWVAAGTLRPLLVDAAGRLSELAGTTLPKLGTAALADTIPTAHRALGSAERILLLSDGVLGGPSAALSRREVAACVDPVGGVSPARTLGAIEQAVRAKGVEALVDDAMTVVLAPVAGTAS